MAWFAKRESNVSSPAQIDAANQASLTEADDVLGSLLRTFGSHSFDIGGGNEAFMSECEAWAEHILLGHPPPHQNVASDKRAYVDLRKFFTTRRKAEAAFVGSAVGELKGAILDMIDNLWQVAQEDSREDTEILSLLSTLMESLDRSPTELRSSINDTVRHISSRIERRERRRKEQLKLLDHRVQDLQCDLAEAKTEAQIDPLTRVWNRAGFDSGIEKRLLYGSLTDEPIVLMLLDLDHFKKINDTYGHPGGDKVLKATADALIRAFPRKSDLVCRYGGEEFAVILQATDMHDAQRLGERFMKDLRKLKISSDDNQISVTCSIGLAVYDSSESKEDLIARADRALYVAKADGRDRLVIAAPRTT